MRKLLFPLLAAVLVAPVVLADGDEPADPAPAPAAADPKDAADPKVAPEPKDNPEPKAPPEVAVPVSPDEDPIPPNLDGMYVRGLRFLAGTQTPEGCWPSDGYGQQAGVVGLAIMAMLAHGDDPNTGPYAVAIQRGIKYILEHQNKDTGYIGDSMYNHGFCCTALAECYGAVDVPGIGPALQKAVDLSLNSQKANRTGGWRYGPDSKDADTSVSGSVLVGLFAARNAGIAVPDEAFTRALGFFDKMRTREGGYGYTSASGPNHNRTAIGVLAFCLAKQRDKPHIKESVKFLMNNTTYRDSAYPFYFEYYMSQALFQADLAEWRKWNVVNIRYLSTIQGPDGSWPGGKGKAFSTSGALLSLALNYRFLPIYER